MNATITKTSWPRSLVDNVETRKRDLVIRVSDWTRTKEEPAYDVEVYIAGVYDWNESKVFSCRGQSKSQARKQAVMFAQSQIEKHLKG